MDTATPELYTLSLHDALPISMSPATAVASWEVMDPGFETRSTRRTVLYPTIAIAMMPSAGTKADAMSVHRRVSRSEEHTSELQSPDHLVCRLLLEKKKRRNDT